MAEELMRPKMVENRSSLNYGLGTIELGLLETKPKIGRQPGMGRRKAQPHLSGSVTALHIMHVQSGATLSVESPAADCVLGLLEDKLWQNTGAMK